MLDRSLPASFPSLVPAAGPLGASDERKGPPVRPTGLAADALRWQQGAGHSEGTPQGVPLAARVAAMPPHSARVAGVWAVAQPPLITCSGLALVSASIHPGSFFQVLNPPPDWTAAGPAILADGVSFMLPRADAERLTDDLYGSTQNRLFKFARNTEFPRQGASPYGRLLQEGRRDAAIAYLRTPEALEGGIRFHQGLVDARMRARERGVDLQVTRIGIVGDTLSPAQEALALILGVQNMPWNGERVHFLPERILADAGIVMPAANDFAVIDGKSLIITFYPPEGMRRLFVLNTPEHPLVAAALDIEKQVMPLVQDNRHLLPEYPPPPGFTWPRADERRAD
jgi:hypothetical protein